MAHIIKSRFVILNKIGKGSFGKIYSAYDKQKNQYVAIKIEKESRAGYLEKENKFYELLRCVVGVPKVIDFGHLDSKESQYLALELLGPSIEQLYINCGKKLSIKTTLILAVQMIERIQFVHERGIVHRDIKPHNFLVGIGKNASMVYVVDFGLAKVYMKNNKHLPYREDKYVIGTVRYISINNHLKIQQSRRDDLESIGYVLVYLVKGGLPWQGLNSDSKRTRKQKICKSKQLTDLNKLCEDIPVEFFEFIRYSKALKFEENPDYAYYKRSFRNALLKMNCSYDFKYDWTI